jgi:hypothetical protein
MILNVPFIKCLQNYKIHAKKNGITTKYSTVRLPIQRHPEYNVWSLDARWGQFNSSSSPRLHSFTVRVSGPFDLAP